MGIQRRVALIGSGEGPWISTQGLREPRAKVTGLREGGRIVIVTCDNPDMVTDAKPFGIEENGIHPIREALWMRVLCFDGGKSVICDILTKKAVA